MDNEIKEEIERKIDNVIAALMEHVDSIRIFVTKQCGDNTCSLNKGSGNYYAQKAQISDWLEKDGYRLQIMAEKEIEEENT